MFRTKFYILLNILFLSVLVVVAHGQGEKSRVGQTNTVNFPVNGEVRIEIIEKIDNPTRVVFTSVTTQKKIADFTLKNGDRYQPFDFNSAINPVTKFRVLEQIKGLPVPLIQAVAVHPGGTDHSFWTILFGEVNGAIKMLSPTTTENSIQGGVHIGDLGTGRGVGMAVYNYLWKDGEPHYGAHQYQVDLYKFDQTREIFAKTETLTTAEKHLTRSNALAELGLNFYENRLNDFTSIREFREDDAEYETDGDTAKQNFIRLFNSYQDAKDLLKGREIVGFPPRIDLSEEEINAAQNEFSKCLANKDTTVRYYCQIYQGYLQKRDEQAQVHFAAAIKLLPENPDAYYFRGKYRILQNDEGRALADFEEAAEMSSQQAEVYFYRGQLLADLDEKDQAIENYTKALKLKPNFTSALILRGYTYAEMDGHIKDAIADATELIRRFPNGTDDQIFQMMRGFFYQQNGDKEKAIADFKTALKIAPDNIVALKALQDMNAKR